MPLVGIRAAFLFEVRMPESFELLGTYVSEFGGRFPDVPAAPGVDLPGIKEDDPDPMFVTLPLLRIGGRSEHGFQWSKPDVERVVAQINEKKVEGILGHPKPEERASRYPLPKLRWIGAMIDASTGVAWGKAYIPTYAKDVREHFRLAKRTGARVGTSVYGLRGDKGLSDMTLEEIDVGHPDRLGFPEAAAIPRITSELNDNQEHKNGEENNPMTGTEGELKLVSELTSAKDNALRQVSELTTKLGDKDKLITEMQGKVETLSGVDKLVAEFAGTTTGEKITKLVSELNDLRKAQKKTQIDTWIADAIKAVELEDLRPTIIAQMGEVESADKAKSRVQELMERPDIKIIAEALALKITGPHAFVGGQSRKSHTEMLKDLEKPESIAEARASLGI